jgi:hypothetical protein
MVQWEADACQEISRGLGNLNGAYPAPLLESLMMQFFIASHLTNKIRESEISQRKFVNSCIYRLSTPN